MNGTTWEEVREALEEMREALDKSQTMYGEQRARTKEARDRAARHEATIAELRAELAEMKSASVPVLETPPPDWNQPFPDECKHYNLPENCHWCKEESTAPVEPVPAPRLEHEALLSIAQYDPRWTGQHVNDSPSRAQLIAKAFDALSSPPVGPTNAITKTCGENHNWLVGKEYEWCGQCGLQRPLAPPVGTQE